MSAESIGSVGDRVARETAAEPVRPGVGLWLPCRTLWQREIVRFLRQKSRVVGALGTPLVFWLLAGGGLGRSFAPAGGSGAADSYLAYTFPGAIAAVLLFTSIFSMISIIDDRREGFMQGVLVSPAPRTAIVLGKVLGATTLGMMQAAVFLALAPLAGLSIGWASLFATLAAMTLVAAGVSSLGFAMAWRMESTQGFHAVMNLVLMPMLILSGAFFPACGAVAPLRWIMAINPMTYGVALLRGSMHLGAGGQQAAGMLVPMGVTVAFAATMLLVSVCVCTRDTYRAA